MPVQFTEELERGREGWPANWHTWADTCGNIIRHSSGWRLLSIADGSPSVGGGSSSFAAFVVEVKI